MYRFFVSLLAVAGTLFSLTAQSPERPTDFSWEMDRNFSLRPAGKSSHFDVSSFFHGSDSASIGENSFSAPLRPSSGGGVTVVPFDFADSRTRYIPPFVFDHNQIMDSPVVGVAPIYMWSGGGIIAMGSRQSYPGLMGIESGSVALRQQIGNVGLTLSGNASKYAGFRSLVTRYSFSGAVDWRINETFSLHAFGSYAPGSRGSLMRAVDGNMGMLGYMGTSNVGGYLSVDFSDRFGVDVGGQGFYNMTTRRWEAQPIVQPYLKLNNGAKIGVDVGGILYQILRSNSRNNWGPNNPTMGPPIPMGPPPVR